MKPVVGIDAHKQTCTYVVRHWDELVEGPKTIPSTEDALRKLAREHAGHALVLEACGVQEWMLDVLRAEGADAVAIVPPKKESKDGKSDGKDADRIARKYLAGDVRVVYVPPPELRRVRDVVRAHEFLKVERISFNNHLKMHLNRWNFHTTKKEDAKRSPNAYSDEGRVQVLEAFPYLEYVYDAVDELEGHLDSLKEQIEELGAGFPEVKLLRSVPGFGPIVALALHVEIGDVNRFTSAEALVSYFGLDPVHSGTAGKTWDEHRISKKGLGYVRGLLAQAAWTHVRVCKKSDITLAYHDLVEKKGKEPVEAIMAVARKLVKTAYWLLKEQREFELSGPVRLAACRTQRVTA